MKHITNLRLLTTAFFLAFLGGYTAFGQCPAPEVAPWVEPLTTTVDPPCWSQTTGGGGPWQYPGNPGWGVTGWADHTNGTPTANYACMDFSGTDASVVLITPEIDVTALTVAELRFWTVSWTDGTILTPAYNSLFLEASDGLGGWVLVDELVGDTGPQWVENIYNVSGYTYGANLVQFRFRAESGGSTVDYENDLLLDDISVVEQPTCPQPSNLTATTVTAWDATFAWTAGGTETEWEIEYGAPGFTPGTGAGTVLPTTNNPETVLGLTPETDYDVYVRAVCSPGDSSWYTGTSITTLISCPQPTSFQVSFADTNSAILQWLAGGVETEWEIEYGPLGFTPGTGTSFITSDNPDTLTGLAIDQFYDVYVTAVCAVGDSSTGTGPETFNTFGLGAYIVYDSQCGPGFNDISGTGTAAGMTDDGELGLALPFSFIYQNQLITDITIGDNGVIVFGTQAANIGFGNGALGAQQQGLYTFWDDLEPNAGDIFYETVGTAPNQQFIVQWNNYSPWNSGGGGTWQAIIDEATSEMYVIYEDVEFNGGGNDFGGSATLGVDGPQTLQVSFNNTQYLNDNSCVHYFYTNCPLPTNYAVSYTTTSEGAITWNAGLANETNWTVIYGPQGFDPTMSGTTLQTTTNALIIPGLDDNTVYDVYIYADCDVNNQSAALVGSFETLPNCADPTGLAGTTAVDSIFNTWNWTMNAGYPISEFAFEYGPTGHTAGTGTYQWMVDTVSYSDTIADANLMSAGLYDVYVQAICGVDSSNWVGPITVTMPMTNDSTCMAQEIPVDGVDYSFNGAGATVQIDETTVAPAAGICTGDMTWCNSSMNFTTWYTFVAPASGNVRIDGEYQGFDGQIAVYEVTQCDSFPSYTLLGANDDDPNTGAGFSFLNLCGLTAGNTYYMVHDPFSTTTTGIYSLRISDVVVEAGTDNGLLDVCLGDTVDLSTQLTGADDGGTWTEEIPTANFNDPIWISSGLASQVFGFQYMVVDGCAVDSVQTSIEIYAPSSAGTDGSISVCQNEPVDLLSGLSGLVDHGGTWYDPSNNTIPSSAITAGAVPGQFNYDYITGNGVCVDDTANVILDVSASCDYLDLQEAYFEGMELYPNPTSNVFYISNAGSSEVFNYELTDLNGKVITSKEAAINGVEETEVNVNNLETGVYLIRIFNETAERTYRVVKQ